MVKQMCCCGSLIRFWSGPRTEAYFVWMGTKLIFTLMGFLCAVLF